jgi:hypothetical protein
LFVFWRFFGGQSLIYVAQVSLKQEVLLPLFQVLGLQASTTYLKEFLKAKEKFNICFSILFLFRRLTAKVCVWKLLFAY